jgi:hypothetical protein
MHTEGSSPLSDKIGTQRHLICARPQSDFSGRFAWLCFRAQSRRGTGFSPAKFFARSSGGGTLRAWEIHIFAYFCLGCCCRLFCFSGAQQSFRPCIFGIAPGFKAGTGSSHKRIAIREFHDACPPHPNLLAHISGVNSITRPQHIVVKWKNAKLKKRGTGKNFCVHPILPGWRAFEEVKRQSGRDLPARR